MPRRDRGEPGSNDVLAASVTRTASGVSERLTGMGWATRLRLAIRVFNITATQLPLTIGFFLEDTHDGTHPQAIWNPPLATINLEKSNRTFPHPLVMDVTTPFTDTLRFRWELRNATAAHFDANLYAE